MPSCHYPSGHPHSYRRGLSRELAVSMNRSPTDLLLQSAQPPTSPDFVYADGKELTMRRFRRDRVVPLSPVGAATQSLAAAAASAGTTAASYKLEAKRQLSDAFETVYGRQLPNSSTLSLAAPTTIGGLGDGAAHVEAGEAYSSPPTDAALAAALPSATEAYEGARTYEEDAAKEAEAFMDGGGVSSREEITTYVSNKAAALEALMHVFVQCDGRNWCVMTRASCLRHIKAPSHQSHPTQPNPGFRAGAGSPLALPSLSGRAPCSARIGPQASRPPRMGAR